MNDIVLSIISIVVTTIVLPLISIAGTKLIKYIGEKTKDQTATRILTNITGIVERAVRTVFQTYVDSLKKSGEFDKEAQIRAYNLAKQEVMVELNQEAKDFIGQNYGDINTFIRNQIEATINILK